MSLRQHDNCKACKSLWYCYFVECGCHLKYSNKKIDENYIPLEPCPKPLDDKEFKLAKRRSNGLL